MKRLVIVLALALCAIGCQRGDIEVSTVFEGQFAPHDGWNFGPDSYIEKGDPVKVTGFVLWLKGLEPKEYE